MVNHEGGNLRGFYVSYDCLRRTNDNVVSQLKGSFGENKVIEVHHDKDKSRL